MARVRQVAGGGRLVLVPPDRVLRWVDGFATRHGAVEIAAVPAPAGGVLLTAADGARAELSAPFGTVDGAGLDALVAHCAVDRVIGVLLVRLGGFAVGEFAGARLVAGKAGSRPVHARAAAGGWSQQRFARRREGQARVALAAAADAAAAFLLPAAGRIEALVGGGDRGAVTEVLADRRLGPLRDLLAPELLEVAEPRRAVLEAAGADARAVRVTVWDASR